MPVRDEVSERGHVAITAEVGEDERSRVGAHSNETGTAASVVAAEVRRKFSGGRRSSKVRGGEEESVAGLDERDDGGREPVGRGHREVLQGKRRIRRSVWGELANSDILGTVSAPRVKAKSSVASSDSTCEEAAPESLVNLYAERQTPSIPLDFARPPSKLVPSPRRQLDPHSRNQRVRFAECPSNGISLPCFDGDFEMVTIRRLDESRNPVCSS